VENIIGKKITSAYSIKDKNDFVVEIVFLLDDFTNIVITVNDDSDELIINLNVKKENENLKKTTFYESLIGKQIVSFWLPTNHLGYTDVFSLGLDEFKPTITVCSICSELNLMSLQKLTR